MNKKGLFKKGVCLLLCVAAAGFSGCGGRGEDSKVDNDGKIKISIGDWPSENSPAELQDMNNLKAKFEEKYPDIEIVPDQWVYDTNSFVPKATSGQLPVLYTTYQTETKKIISAKYAKNITANLQKKGWIEKINPTFTDLISKDGEYYGLIRDAYIMGLTANVKLFKDAGLVDENGVPKFPDTYDELAETAKTIKDKTGKAGFILPTTNNCGGWHFMNIAWSFGVEFMKQENGKWVSTFDSPEAVKALQYVKDLKWKYDVLPANALIDIPEMQKQFATDQAAMYFSAPPNNELSVVYGMPLDRFSAGMMPKGEAGRYTLSGGKVYMFSPEATDEQVEAGLKWLEMLGVSPNFNEDVYETLESSYKTTVDNGGIVGISSNLVWNDKERVEKMNELTDKYRNVNKKFVEQYEQFDKVTVKAEEPICCQQLYSIIDSVIQEVITEKDSDPAALLKKANEDFQKNYLDKNQ